MKTKVIIFIFATALFTGAYFSCSYAEASVDKMYMVMTAFNPYSGFVYLINENSYLEITPTKYILHGYTSWYAINGERGMSVDEVLAYTISQENTAPTMPPVNNNAVTSFDISDFPLFICSAPIVSGTPPENGFFSSLAEYDEYINPTPEKSWWDVLWETVEDYFENPIPGGWIRNLINRLKDDENEDSLVDNVTLEAPTIAPTPTNIPYSTIIVPNTDIIPGTTVNEIQYIYNVSGTPIITQSPPPDSGGEGGSGDGGGEYHPKGGDPYSIPSLDWLTSAKLGDTSYNGIDSLSNGMDSINEVGSEYNDGMSTVQDSTGVLPSNWLLLIGIAAAIPLIAGIISRFLS